MHTRPPYLFVLIDDRRTTGHIHTSSAAPPPRGKSGLTPTGDCASILIRRKLGGPMRVTIEHREATSGVLGTHKESYVDCTVNFSEEERAIVQARDLYREGFFVRTSTPLPSSGSTVGTRLMRGFGPLLIVGGLLYGMIVEGLAHAQTNYGAPALFLGIGLTVFGLVPLP